MAITRQKRAKSSVHESGSSQGPATDSSNNPVIDPTENVLGLVDAATVRQDDLRAAFSDLAAMRVHYLEQTRDISLKYMEKLAAAESRRVDEKASIRAEYIEKLSLAEAKRIDAIRAVDVNAVSVAAERANAQAGVLATQVATSADALRTLVGTTAQTLQLAQQQLQSAFNERITKVEQAQYTGAGRALIADPQIEALLQQMKALAAAQATNAGAKQGIGSLGQIAVGGAIIFGAIVTFYSLFNGGKSPQVVYVPAPTTQSK